MELDVNALLDGMAIKLGASQRDLVVQECRANQAERELQAAQSRVRVLEAALEHAGGESGTITAEALEQLGLTAEAPAEDDEAAT